MNLRYYLEMTFFLVNVLVFQYYISQFNSDLHLLQKDIDHLVDLGEIERDEDGRLLSSKRNLSVETEDIAQTKAHLAYEIELAVFELDEAMFVAMISFSFPAQLVMAIIYASYTNRNFVMRSTSWLDLGIFTCVVVWFEKYEEYLHASNDGF